MRSRWACAAVVAYALARTPAAWSAPPAEQQAFAPDEPDYVIPPGHEDAARELLRAALDQTTDPLRWIGPQIEIDRIKWSLERDGRAVAEVVALPRGLGERGAGQSESFTIQLNDMPGATLEDGERALLDAAVASIAANDRGDFYVHRETAFAGAPPYVRDQPSTPAEVRRRWAIEFSGVGLLVLFAFIVTMRPEPRRSS